MTTIERPEPSPDAGRPCILRLSGKKGALAVHFELDTKALWLFGTGPAGGQYGPAVFPPSMAARVAEWAEDGGWKPAPSSMGVLLLDWLNEDERKLKLTSSIGNSRAWWSMPIDSQACDVLLGCIREWAAQATEHFDGVGDNRAGMEPAHQRKEQAMPAGTKSSGRKAAAKTKKSGAGTKKAGAKKAASSSNGKAKAAAPKATLTLDILGAFAAKHATDKLDAPFRREPFVQAGRFYLHITPLLDFVAKQKDGTLGRREATAQLTALGFTRAQFPATNAKGDTIAPGYWSRDAKDIPGIAGLAERTPPQRKRAEGNAEGGGKKD